MAKLAINGGDPVRKKLFPNQSTIGKEEIEASIRVLKSGLLTGYQGNSSTSFFGGPEVRKLERAFEDFFGVSHAIACNSATSGLFAACKILDLKIYEIVIVSPFSMSCSATMPKAAGGMPLFADIDPGDFCIDGSEFVSVSGPKRIRAILVVDLFGNIYNYEYVNKTFHDSVIIEDAAQAIGSLSKGRYAGTFGDVGIFSFNQGKGMTCGEGGMIVTNDDYIARECRLIINHAEAVINELKQDSISYWNYGTINKSMIGFNLRMTESQATVANEQLKKLTANNIKRNLNAKLLQNYLSEIPGITPSISKRTDFNSYYCVPFCYNSKIIGVHRDIFIEAVKAELTPSEGRVYEGVPISCGYVKPIYKMPVFASKKLYEKVHLKNVEYMHNEALFIIHRMHGPNSSTCDIDDIISAFNKVYENINELKKEG